MSKKIAIITGASSGLGSRLLDADSEGAGAGEFHLDALWIIARRKERLEELAAGLRTDTDVIALDLTDKTSVTQLQEKLSAERPDVRMLINAAGSGKIAASAALPLEQVDQMIDLNCRAAVDVTQICLPYMDSGAKIMEICSTAAFQPIPYLNVYAASKAFLYRYSRALRFELRPRDITVTAVCPYWIKDTEFIFHKQNRRRKSAHGYKTRTFRFNARLRLHRTPRGGKASFERHFNVHFRLAAEDLSPRFSIVLAFLPLSV